MACWAKRVRLACSRWASGQGFLAPQPFFQCGLGGGGAGHHAAQEGQGGPVADAAPPAGEGVAAADQFPAELVDLPEEGGVGGGEVVGFLHGDALREGGVGAEPAGDVAAAALDDVTGQGLVRRFAQGVEVQGGEVGVEEGQEGAEGLLHAAVGGGGEEEEVTVGVAGQVAQELVALLLGGAVAGGLGGAVGLVHDDELGAVEEEVGPMPLGLGVVNADDDVGVVLKDAAVGRGLPLQGADGAGADDDGGEVELFRQFLLPLVAEVRGAEDGDAADFAAGQEFAGDEEGLNGLADADVIGDEEADGVEAEGHEEGDELVGAGADGDAAQGAEGAGAVPEGEAGGVPEEFGGEGVGGVVGGGEGELGGGQFLHAPPDQGEVDPADLGLVAGEGAQQSDVGVRGWDQDPLPPPCADDGADGERGGYGGGGWHGT